MPDPVDIHVGKRIRLMRWSAGMTQQDLAALIGVKFQQLQKYETAANRVSASRLWKIAEALETDISTFFEGYVAEKPEEEAIEKKDATEYTRETAELMALCQDLPDSSLSNLIRLVKTMQPAQK